MSETKNLGQEPAFPNESNAYMQMPDCFGMSKRFYAACAAMQGILANEEMRLNITIDQSKGGFSLAKYAFEYADQLLKQENNQ